MIHVNQACDTHLSVKLKMYECDHQELVDTSNEWFIQNEQLQYYVAELLLQSKYDHYIQSYHYTQTFFFKTLNLLLRALYQILGMIRPEINSNDLRIDWRHSTVYYN